MRIILNQYMNHPTPSQHILETVARHLDGFDARFTDGRRRLVEHLVESTGPRTPADLHASLAGRMPLSSLYRGLAVLEEAGVLSRHTGADGLSRYEIAERFVGHHHHLVCTACGEMVDVALGASAESAIGEVADNAASSAGYLASGHGLEIKGLCASCR